MDIATKNELSDIENLLNNVAMKLANISESSSPISEYVREKISKAANSVMVSRCSLVDILRAQ